MIFTDACSSSAKANGGAAPDAAGTSIGVDLGGSGKAVGAIHPSLSAELQHLDPIELDIGGVALFGIGVKDLISLSP